MESESEITIIEQERNPYLAIEYFEKLKNKNLDIYLRVLFILLDFLVDEQYTEQQHDFISLKVKELYSEAELKYSNDNDFLFFSGIMIYIAEWYFGMKIEEGQTMLKKAMDANPENIIYKWGYFSITDQRVTVNTKTKFLLSNQIMKDDLILNWIKNKGLLGEYLLGIIQYTYEHTKVLI